MALIHRNGNRTWLTDVASQCNPGADGTLPHLTQCRLHYLGTWILRQPKELWYQFTKSAPLDPVLSAKLTGGFCGVNTINISRMPLGATGKATWTTCLAMFHEKRHSSRTKPASSTGKEGSYVVEVEEVSGPSSDRPSWHHLPTRPLVRQGSSTYIIINRATLITLLSLMNARQMFRYSVASGHRAAYASYCGHWYIEWPLGGAAVVRLAPHDSHSASSDVYPRTFERRVDKCIEMTAGVIISSPSHYDKQPFRCTFPGRKSPGSWTLEYQRKGFPSAHRSRHLFNMMGGKVYEVDFLLARRLIGLHVRPERGANHLNKGTRQSSMEHIVMVHTPWLT
ncbi:MAG: hypothetical protein M1836_006045 [Candelina mexicana]|nr:MAG: hypothetical protein M1836_006045 [Candelina mexicana]